MKETGRLSRHFWLTQGMARAVGVNLNAALQSGRLARADYAETIAECCGCPHCRNCLAWLAVHGAGAETPPGFCTLGPLMARLK